MGNVRARALAGYDVPRYLSSICGARRPYHYLGRLGSLLY